MKKNSISLIIATAVLSMVSSCSTPSNNESSEATSIDTASIVMNNIMTRTSVREFQDKAVDDSVIEQILRAGMAAPSARNAQPWSFGVVKDKDLLNRIAEENQNASMCNQAAFAIVVCADTNRMLDGEGRDYWIDDCSAATENILLAAHALGLGAVWTGAYPKMDRVESIRSILNIPSNELILCVIPIGYPNEAQAPKDKWKPEYIHYDRW